MTSNPSQHTIQSSVVSKTIKKKKSKIVSKKINTITNPNKRKLDEHEYDTHINNEPNRKKMKYNSNNNKTNNKLKAVIESLKKQNSQYKHRLNVYKKEAEKWKSQYMKLHSKMRLVRGIITNELSDVTSINMNDSESEIEIEINANNTLTAIQALTPSPTPPPSKYFHQTRKKTNQNVPMRVNNNNEPNDSDEHNADMTETHKPYSSSHNNSVSLNESESEYTEFERSYYVSVHCHICEKHFNDFQIYTQHLRKHYDNNPLKAWLKCDFECKRTEAFEVNRSFVYHITSSHTKQKPFICNVIINGIQCRTACTTKRGLKQHWQKIHCKKQNCNRKKIRALINFKYNESEYELYDETESDSYTEYDDIYNDNIECNIAFENSYLVSVDCHICNQHFDDIDEYKYHIKQHYETDPNRNWRECDFGCTKGESGIPFVSANVGGFIVHISTHTKQKPFQCNSKVHVNGIKCKHSASRKDRLKRHWKLYHWETFEMLDTQESIDDNNIAKVDSTKRRLRSNGKKNKKNICYNQNVDYITSNTNNQIV